MMRRWKRALKIVLWGAVASGCAHAEPGAREPEAPAAAAPPAASEGPKTTLHVSAKPIEALRSQYFAALEITFENPSNAWHEVRRVDISPERQMFGPSLEAVVGPRLRAWQLAAREARPAGDGPPHVALDALAPEAPAGGEAASGVGGAGAPAQHLLSGAFIVAPGLSIRRWVVLYSPAQDGLLGQDLLLAYELENGQVERVLVQYPKPAADH
jgi:hypothetical protein